MENIKNKRQKLRFIAVGITNTAIDFGLFLGLSNAGIPPVMANFVATTTALCFSFGLNKKYTFTSRSKNLKKEVMLFLAVTLTALWILQPIVLTVTSRVISNLTHTDMVVLIIAKVAATLISLIWNYTLYSRLVFKDSEDPT